jgi:pimeloyl-ACP methyl ester carboxylesterase
LTLAAPARRPRRITPQVIDSHHSRGQDQSGVRSTSNTDQLNWRPRVLYDGRIVDGFRLHADRVGTLDTPALVIDGGQTPWMSRGAEALAAALPNGTQRRLEGQEHGPSPEVVAAVLIEFCEA